MHLTVCPSICPSTFIDWLRGRNSGTLGDFWNIFSSKATRHHNLSGDYTWACLAIMKMDTNSISLNFLWNDKKNMSQRTLHLTSLFCGTVLRQWLRTSAGVMNAVWSQTYRWMSNLTEESSRTLHQLTEVFLHFPQHFISDTFNFSLKITVGGN